jgi:hypothetical protein
LVRRAKGGLLGFLIGHQLSKFGTQIRHWHDGIALGKIRCNIATSKQIDA